LDEIAKYQRYLLDKTRRTHGEYLQFFRLLERRLIFLPRETLLGFLEQARLISPDPDDIPYFACALRLGCGIWSNDAMLKNQSEVLILSTREILEMLD